MKRFARHAGLVLFILSALFLAGRACNTTHGRSSSEDALDRDNLVGWFKMPDCDHFNRELVPGHERVVPIYKIDSTYCTVMGGFEVALKECSGGLEWVSEPGSEYVTEIAFDKAALEPYLILKGKKSARADGHPISGLKLPMARIEKPAWAVDAVTPRPRTNDDFIGLYRPVWLFTDTLFEIKKEGGKYLFGGLTLEESGRWKHDEAQNELKPISDELGFHSEEDSGGLSFVYGPTRKRYVFNLNFNGVWVCMPLERMPALPTTPRLTPPSNVEIGITTYR